MFALLPANQWRQDHYFCSHRLLHHRIDDLACRLAGDHPPADPAMRRPRAGEEHAQVIVDFRRRRHRRTRVAAGRPLLNGNRRRQAFNLIDIRLLQLIEELPRIRRQRFDVFPLSLGIDGIERQRRFSRAGQAGDDDQLIAGDIDVNVFEIVLAGAADSDGFSNHRHGYR